MINYDNTLKAIHLNKNKLISTQESLKQSIIENPKHLKKNLFNTKILWNKYEDNKWIKIIQINGEKNWKQISKWMETRNPKQCRERWHNHLNPENCKKSKWNLEEENILIKAHKKYGNKWSLISKLIPGRSDNNIKNYWNSNLKIRKNNFYKKKIKFEFPIITSSDLFNNYIFDDIQKFFRF